MRRIIWYLIILVSLPNLASAGQFKKPVYYPVPGLPLAVVTADFNNDGNLDLAVADFGDGVVRTLLGKGDGTFRKGPFFSVPQGYAPANLAIGDFNGDGIPDLAVVEYAGTTDGQLGIYLGNGDGSFRESAQYAAGYEPISAAVADFNGDGHLDVALVNEGVNRNGSALVFFGKGDGTFKPPVTYKLANQPYSVAAGDLNGDGHPDLAVAEVWGGVSVLINRDDGTFRKPADYRVNPEVSDVVIADVNKDGKPDLIATTNEAIAILLNTGGGKFGKAKTYSTRLITNESSPVGLTVADFNLDGNPDIAVVIFGYSAGLFYGRGDGTFKTVVPIKLQKDTGGEWITAGDFSKNFAPDLAILDGRGYADILINTQ